MVNVKKFLKETPHFSVCLMLNETIVINIPPPNNFTPPRKIRENVELSPPIIIGGGGGGGVGVETMESLCGQQVGLSGGISWTQWDSMMINKGQVRVTGPHWS